MKGRFWVGLLQASALVGMGACAGPPRLRLPEGEDYVFPAVHGGEIRGDERHRMEEAWQDVLAGRAEAAERAFLKILSRRPGLVPAETGLAFARLRGGRLPEAARTFDEALVERPDYVPALIGAASAAVRRGDPELALGFYRRALAVSPEDPTARRRLGEVKVQVTERRVAAARAAAAAGDLDRAQEEYRRALDAAPEVAGVRLELADLLASHEDLTGAVALLEADPAQDPQVLARLGELQSMAHDYGKALQAYRRILSRDPRDPEAQRRALEAREALELQGMPEEYRKIYESPRLTRADLAALLAVKVTALARLRSGEPQVAVDISGSWAREHIIKVLSLEIMDVYSNHTFQPGAVVRRGDLAQSVARILDLLRRPRSQGPAVTDMTPSNLLYEGVARTVAAGLMDLTASGAFEAWRPVSGQDAVAVVDGLVRAVGP